MPQYRALKIVSIVYQFAAVLVGVGGILAGVALLIVPSFEYQFVGVN